MTIQIKDNIDDLTAISLVKQVIERGKISNNGIYQYLVTPVLKQDNIENHHVLEYIEKFKKL